MREMEIERGRERERERESGTQHTARVTLYLVDHTAPCYSQAEARR